jgi:hypothetical protein
LLSDPDILYNVPEGVAGSPTRMGGGLQSVTQKTGSNLKENLKLTGRFLETLIKKLPDIVEDNPVKVVLSLAKAIAEAKNVRCRCSSYPLL